MLGVRYWELSMGHHGHVESFAGTTRYICRLTGINFIWLLGRLRKVRNCLIKANPLLRTGGVYVQHGLEVRRIVQRGKSDGRDL